MHMYFMWAKRLSFKLVLFKDALNNQDAENMEILRPRRVLDQSSRHQVLGTIGFFLLIPAVAPYPHIQDFPLHLWSVPITVYFNRESPMGNRLGGGGGLNFPLA